MSAIAAELLSAERFFAWSHRPENQGKVLELEQGEVVEMPPPGRLHGTICFLIARILGNYLFQRGGGSLCTNDTGLLVEEDPDTLRGPDVMLFLESHPLDEITVSFSEDVPDLIVEVFSPADRWTKMNARVAQYLARGVPMVWVVEPSDLALTVHRLGKPVEWFREADELTGNGVLPDFRCKVAELFTLPGS